MSRIKDGELPTVLLALRWLQRRRDDAIQTITEGGLNPYGEILSEDEIDTLCERINCEDANEDEGQDEDRQAAGTPARVEDEGGRPA